MIRLEAMTSRRVQRSESVLPNMKSNRLTIAESNLTSIGHTVLAFKEVPETPQENAIYLKPHAMPKIEIGAEIVFD